MKNSWLRRINAILDFGPIIFTVLVATFASLKSAQSGITSDEMLQLVLIVLALLATTQLVDRFRVLRDIDSKVRQLIAGSRTLSTADAIFEKNIPQLSSLIKGSRVVWVNGITLLITTTGLLPAWKPFLRKGGRIRFMTIDPNHPAVVTAAAARLHKHQRIEELKDEVMIAHKNIRRLNQRLGLSDDVIKVRVSTFVPPYAIWLFDAKTPDAEMWVWLYPFRAVESPVFHLDSRRDKVWFEYFERQFEMMWNVSKGWEKDDWKTDSDDGSQ
jgi:hypothetical protein